MPTAVRSDAQLPGTGVDRSDWNDEVVRAQRTLQELQRRRMRKRLG